MSPAEAIEQSAARLAAGHIPDPPYTGIRPFEEKEWPIFFGRDPIIEQILERLSRDRFVAVAGASGSGKSSLITAGLFATLKRKHARLGIRWETVTMRPAGSPMWSLAEALRRATAPGAVAADHPVAVTAIEPHRAALARGRHAIAAILQEERYPSTQNLLLLVDQFEELFRYDILGGEAEVQAFLEQLADVVDEPPEGFYLALTMRSDFLSDCARFPRFADALNRSSYLLRRMTEDELADAIVLPAELLGGCIESDLLHCLLRDAQREQDHLVLLQHALTWLWRRKRRRLVEAGTPEAPVVLDLADYQAVGGMAGALSQHLNSIYEGLGGTDSTPDRRENLQLATKRLFQSLVDIGEHARATRRPLRFAQLAEETDLSPPLLAEVIDAFRAPGRSFLVPAFPLPIDDATVIDVGHEALIRQWDKLGGPRSWLWDEQQDAEAWRQLRSRTEAFSQNSRRLLDPRETQELASFWRRRRSIAWLRRYHRPTTPGSTPDDRDSAEKLAEKADRLLKVSRARQRRRKTGVYLLVSLLIGSFFSSVISYYYLKAEEERHNADLASLNLKLVKQKAAQSSETLQQISGRLQQIDSIVAEKAPASGISGQIAQVQKSIEAQADTLATVARGPLIDEARQAGRSALSFPAADEDYFRAMDDGITLTPDEVKGRNMWIVWTGGNDRLWDELTNITFGNFDLLKILSSYPGLKYSRDNRWNYFGLVNEPCFSKATGPNPQRYGLWLDVRDPNCPPDPFENAQKYPGVAVGARGKNLSAGSYYGYPTGIVGLRLFPNPDFNEAAAKEWNAERFYNDPNYYLSKELVRPYRVGVSCGFCHIGPNPEKPPANPEAPQWGNLSSAVGAQYFWVDRIFAWNADQSTFFFQLLHTARPGSLDTSLVSSDNINNPRTMNAVYNLLPRLEAAKRWGQETLGPDNLANKQFNDFVSQGPLTQFFQPPNTVWTPHVLKDGADSVGALGALNRVYLNIGLFSEEWLRHFNPILGGKPVTPIQITTARANSSYWGATELQTSAMALFLLKASYPHKLKNAPGGAAYLNDPPETVNRGKVIFAENCAACHSSKAPQPPVASKPAMCIGAGYLDCWNRYWEWTKTTDFKQQMRQIVSADDFLDDNFLSNDMRVPVTLLQTNACSPLATNAIAGNIWDNFSSASYKELPSVGAITVYNPFTGAPQQYQMPAGGRGYTRVPSLVSLWATAPYLLNNSVGRFNQSPSVEARMASFNDSITQMLWPERRDKDPVFGDKIPGVIDRTTATSWLRIPVGYLPDVIKDAREVWELITPNLGGLEIGPIPAGTPVDLLANFEPLPPTASPRERLANDKAVVKAVVTLVRDLKALPPNATDEQARHVFANAGEQLFALSKCPDYVVNRGHYFGANLADADKQALIAFLKTF